MLQQSASCGGDDRCATTSSRQRLSLTHQAIVYKFYWVHTLTWLVGLALATGSHVQSLRHRTSQPPNRLLVLKSYQVLVALLESIYGVLAILLLGMERFNDMHHWIWWHAWEVLCVAGSCEFVLMVGRIWEISTDRMDCMDRVWIFVAAWFYGFWFVVWEQTTTTDGVLFVGIALAWCFVAFHLWFYSSKSIFVASRTISLMQQQQQQQQQQLDNLALTLGSLLAIRSFFVQFRRALGVYLTCSLIVATSKFSVFSSYGKYQWVFIIAQQILHVECSVIVMTVFHRCDAWRLFQNASSLSSRGSRISIQPVVLYPAPTMLTTMPAPANPVTMCASGPPGATRPNEANNSNKKKNSLVVVLNPQAGAAIAYGVPHRHDDDSHH